MSRLLIRGAALPAVLALGLACDAAAQAPAPDAAAPRGFDARDLVELERASAPTLSPDGRRLVFAVREASLAENRARTGLWVEDLLARDAAPPVRLTPEGLNMNSPAFSADGRTVYYLAAADGVQQLFAIPATGGEPRQLTRLPLDVGTYRLSPDGDRVAISLEVFPDCDTLACTRERLDAPRAASGVTYDTLFARHWDSWADGRRNQLFVAELGRDGVTGEPVRVSDGLLGDVPGKPFGGVEDYAWSPDGERLVFALRLGGNGLAEESAGAPCNTEACSTNFDLYEVRADGRGEPRNLTAANRALDAGPVFSADGRTLFYRAMRRPGFEADRLAIMAMDVASGATREVAPGWDRSADGITLSADGRAIYTLTDDVGVHALYRIDVATGEATNLSGRDSSIAGFALAGDTLALLRHSITAPADVFVARADGSAERRITTLNADRLAGVAMGGYEQFSFPGWNGETVHGYVVKPWDYVEGRTYPVAFLIHGGPQGSFGNTFHYRWNPQTYAGQGFAVVMIDFHGSTGYGQAFTDSISGDWGGKPLEDLQKGWAAAQQRYAFLDGQRACALGGSYGGYMVNWIAGQWPDGFRCLVNHAGVFDTRMMGTNTEELWFSEWENGGTPWANPEAYERHNPARFVSEWRAPMLVIHGQLDYRVLVEQGLASYSAAQRRGIPSRLLYFPDENHWILKPANSVQWHDEVNAWLRQHTAERAAGE